MRNACKPRRRRSSRPSPRRRRPRSKCCLSGVHSVFHPRAFNKTPHPGLLPSESCARSPGFLELAREGKGWERPAAPRLGAGSAPLVGNQTSLSGSSWGKDEPVARGGDGRGENAGRSEPVLLTPALGPGQAAPGPAAEGSAAGRAQSLRLPPPDTSAHKRSAGPAELWGGEKGSGGCPCRTPAAPRSPSPWLPGPGRDRQQLLGDGAGARAAPSAGASGSSAGPGAGRLGDRRVPWAHPKPPGRGLRLDPKHPDKSLHPDGRRPMAEPGWTRVQSPRPPFHSQNPQPAESRVQG